jgi:hypothetical protein
MATMYAVRNTGSQKIISPWTPDKDKAEEWAKVFDFDENERMMEVVEKEMTDLEILSVETFP